MNTKRAAWIIWNVFLVAAAWFGFLRGARSAHLFIEVYVWLSLVLAILAAGARNAEIRAAMAAKHIPILLDIAFDVAVTAIVLASGSWGYAAVYLFSGLLMAQLRVQARETTT